MSYQPRPLDTSAVELPASLSPLIEKLAEHNHDLWAEGRLQQGWTLGPHRDDARKQHPCLVPYAQLPESEKEIDRRTAMGILKAIHVLGFRVVEA